METTIPSRLRSDASRFHSQRVVQCRVRFGLCEGLAHRALHTPWEGVAAWRVNLSSLEILLR